MKDQMTRILFALIPAAFLAGCSQSPAPAPNPPAAASAAVGSIVRLDPALDAVLPKDAQIEKVAGGFTFIEGPLWRPSGALWFSDVIGDVVRQWSPDGAVTMLFRPGGSDGVSLPAGGYNGPNGMTADKDGGVLLCQHGFRRIVRIGKDMQMTLVADKYEGKKLNSPNDLVYRSDGSLFFTDPPYGLPKDDSDPAKELKFNGVFKLTNGKLQVIVKDLNRPNGIAFSPDEKVLYVSNSDEKHRFWMHYDVAADGTSRTERSSRM
jgi:gluconolactonase